MLERKPIFDAVRLMLGRGFSAAEVAALDAAIDRATGAPAAPPPASRQLGDAGRALIHKWEGCARKREDGRFDAYPDPGSANGHPWTIGWGSTGSDIGPGTIWTAEECDARFNEDIQRYVKAVDTALGDTATSQNQFDALVSFHYNTGAITRATLTRLHRQGLYADAETEFGKWIYNDGKIMNGLRNRRREEAALYHGT